MKITFKSSTTLIEGSLNDSKTARDIYKALPIVAEVETWGDEIYFETPVK